MSDIFFDHKLYSGKHVIRLCSTLAFDAETRQLLHIKTLHVPATFPLILQRYLFKARTPVLHHPYRTHTTHQQQHTPRTLEFLFVFKNPGLPTYCCSTSILPFRPHAFIQVQQCMPRHWLTHACAEAGRSCANPTSDRSIHPFPVGFYVLRYETRVQREYKIRP